MCICLLWNPWILSPCKLSHTQSLGLMFADIPNMKVKFNDLCVTDGYFLIVDWPIVEENSLASKEHWFSFTATHTLPTDSVEKWKTKVLVWIFINPSIQSIHPSNPSIHLGGCVTVQSNSDQKKRTMVCLQSSVSAQLEWTCAVQMHMWMPRGPPSAIAHGILGKTNERI